VSGAPANLWGSFVPLLTPFDDERIDHEAFEAAIERQIAAGSHGLVVTGTSGEPTSLSLEERAELHARAVRVGAGRVPVVAATGTSNQAETIALSRSAEAAGADAILVVTPAFVKPSQAGLVEHFSAVAAAVEMPVLIYNIPGRSAVGVSGETVERIVEQRSNVVGLKHASNELDLVTDLLLRLGDDFRLFCGLESFSYPFLALGAAGLMSAVGNVFPAQVARLCEAVRDNDHGTALELHRRLFRVNQAVFFDTNPGPLKAMQAQLGLGSDEVRPPLAPLSDATRQRVLATLETVSDMAAAV
jgi:4-hydroxy-tetrahydrodipicolinate synthase